MEKNINLKGALIYYENKKIALALLLSVSVNMVGPQLAFASETKSDVTSSTIESQLGDLDNFTTFNPDKMTENQKKVYNKSINKQVELMKKNLEIMSPEDAAADYLDSIDSYPNDGYFDVIL